MFTGVVEEVGEITGLRQSATSTVLGVRAKTVLGGTQLGDSIAVNGVCLTVVRLTADGFEGDVMPETMRRTNLGALRPKSRVNLERAMAADGRFGGHIVAGHVDGTGTITDLSPEGNAVWVTVAAAPNILRYIVEKGSRQLPIFTSRFQLTILGTSELNYCVRNGNRWDLTVIVTDHMTGSVYHTVYCLSSVFRRTCLQN